MIGPWPLVQLAVTSSSQAATSARETRGRKQQGNFLRHNAVAAAAGAAGAAAAAAAAAAAGMVNRL